MSMGRGSSASDVGSSDVLLLKEEVNEIRHKLDSLIDITEALWVIIKEDGKYSEEQLEDKVKAVHEKKTELRSLKRECPSCGMSNSPKIIKCMYCGVELDESEANSGAFSFRF